MKAKKTPQADLERKRFGYTQLGLLMALAMTLAAFEWTSFSDQRGIAMADTEEVWMLDEEVIVTERAIKQPQRPVSATVIQTPLEIEITTEELPEPINEQEPDIDFPDDFYNDDEDEYYTGAATTAEDDLPFVLVEDMPYMCDCSMFTDSAERADCTTRTMFTHLQNNIRVPASIRESRIAQTAYVYFVVDRKGQVTNVSVANREHVDVAVAKEAERVVSTLPCWNPGRQRGQAVKVQYTLPIKFAVR